ncbi:phage replisome organizer N-terminal domain-containing protein, partial [Clostridium sp. CMCC3676]|uniref:phage replisome organizer N-terminal domain-containing protein n=1 Tax=Clostridium sp. CMCC3676 TaxID=2949964 RepID=UPI0020795F21
MLATLFNRDVGIIRVTLHTLQSFGMIQKTENGLIEIENWEKHQNVDGMERVEEEGCVWGYTGNKPTKDGHWYIFKGDTV